MMASEGRQKGPSERPLTLGSYYRTVSQAKSNVREAVVTVLLALRLGMIKQEDLRKLFELVGAGSRELSDEESERVLQVLEAILGRIIP